MWDTKRQIIWFASGLALGTLVFYREALDEAGRFDLGYFLLLEVILIGIILLMFYFYSKK